MGRVILFDGGVAGGIHIDGGTANPIPPFAPSVLAHLQAVSNLLEATHEDAMEAKACVDLHVLTTRVANSAIERVEAAIGPLDSGDALIYLQGKKGFVCSSTGAPPRSIEWPVEGHASVEDFVKRGLLGGDVLEFLRLAHEKGLSVRQILEDPVASAMIVGIKLSDLAISNLSPLAPSNVDKIPDPVTQRAIRFFHHVIEDGRFLDRWMAEPTAVAKSLGVELDREVVDRILGSSAVVGQAEPVARLSIQQGIVVGVTLFLLDRPDFTTVKDQSTVEKF